MLYIKMEANLSHLQSQEIFNSIELDESTFKSLLAPKINIIVVQYPKSQSSKNKTRTQEQSHWDQIMSSIVLFSTRRDVA